MIVHIPQPGTSHLESVRWLTNRDVRLKHNIIYIRRGWKTCPSAKSNRIIWAKQESTTS